MYSAPDWPERKISLSWSSTLPPGPNQARPLWEKEGQAWTKTITISASSRPTTVQTNAPSICSTRWSDHLGPYSGGNSSTRCLVPARLLVEGGDAAGFGDDLSGERAGPRPVDEFLHRRAGVGGRQDDEDV